MLKLSGLFDNNRSMHEGSFRFLKQVGCFIRLCELKSLSRITLLHFHESESIFLERQFICDLIALCFGLKEQLKSHFFLQKFSSTFKRFSLQTFKRFSIRLDNFHRDVTLKEKNKSPPFQFRFKRNSVPKFYH